jgi:site-specific DNA-methyltransferase (adenine-specific)
MKSIEVIITHSTNMKVDKVKISEVKTNPKNPRLIKDDKFKKLVKSIQEFPQMLELRPIVVDENNIVLGGNMRLKACKEAGLKEVYIVKAENLTELQKDEFIVKDNVGFGEWDWDMLANEWDTEKLDEWGLDLPVDLSVQEILEAEEDDYEVPNEINTDIVLGDLFEIGEHRLLCGDSTDSDLIEKLLNGNKPELLLTDPPYGIDYGGMLKGKGDGKGGADKNGWKSYDAPDWDKSKPESGVLQYLCQITDNQIIWGGNYFTDDLPPTMGWLIWDKGQRGFSLADGEMAWTSFNNALRIKEYARAKANQEEKNHPTQKPQEIMNWCFEYADRHSKKEIKLVLDAYLGSGSTMVASHQLKRKCYGMELDPKYCQVIIDRMKKLDPSLVIKRNGEIIRD